MNLVLLEAVAEGLPPIITGILTLLFLLAALGSVLIMGSGRPHSK